MSIQGQVIYYGEFTSDGNPTIIDFPGDVTNYFQMNWTQWNSTANPGVLKRAWFHFDMPDDSYLGVQNTNGAATDQSILALAGGYTRFSYDNLQTYATTAITGATAATPVVVTSVAHGLRTGDLVRLSNVTGMQQVSGYECTATRLTANTFSVPITGAGFAAAGTGGTARRIAQDRPYAPRRRFINTITAANPAVVTTTQDHGFAVGEVVSFRVPTEYGMEEINNLTGTITVVAGVNTFTVNIDSSAFTAFAFPTSAVAAVGVTQAHVVPVGDATGVLSGATDNVGFRGLELGTAVVGASADIIKWVGWKGELINIYH
jgi:hypothetical protein